MGECKREPESETEKGLRGFEYIPDDFCWKRKNKSKRKENTFVILVALLLTRSVGFALI